MFLYCDYEECCVKQHQKTKVKIPIVYNFPLTYEVMSREDSPLTSVCWLLLAIAYLPAA